MQAVVLAAGQGQRLRPDTDDLPKTLLPVDGDDTILDVILANLAEVGVTDVAVVVGYAAHAIESRLPRMRERYRMRLSPIHNDNTDWNNAYSLWHARAAFADGALLVNGDTVHPASVLRDVLAADGTQLRLAVDTVKTLTDEAMKVRLGADGTVTTITKLMPVADAYGEYIGVGRIGAAIAPALTDALEKTWREDPTLYYEDAFQKLAADGALRPVPIGAVDWVEVDDHADLTAARDVMSRAGSLVRVD